MNSSQRSSRHQHIHDQVNQFLEESYFDVQGMTGNFATLDEAYLARVLTKLAIGSATVWWSILEVKDFFSLRRKSKF